MNEHRGQQRGQQSPDRTVEPPKNQSDPPPPSRHYREPWHPGQETPQPLVQYSVDVMDENMGRHAGYVLVRIDAGPRGTEHHVPPAGPLYAFDTVRWARRVEVTVSPTGRSARVWVDGREIKMETNSDGDTPREPSPAPADPERPA